MGPYVRYDTFFSSLRKGKAVCRKTTLGSTIQKACLQPAEKFHRTPFILLKIGLRRVPPAWKFFGCPFTLALYSKRSGPATLRAARSTAVATD